MSFVKVEWLESTRAVKGGRVALAPYGSQKGDKWQYKTPTRVFPL